MVISNYSFLLFVSSKRRLQDQYLCFSNSSPLQETIETSTIVRSMKKWCYKGSAILIRNTHIKLRICKCLQRDTKFLQPV